VAGRLRGVPKRRDSQAWRYGLMVFGVVAAVGVVVVALLTGRAQRENPDDVDCSRVKCVALTFDDGPSPYTDRLLQVLKDNNAKATFFLIGNKVAANPDGAKRIAEAGMEVASHTWEHPNMTTIPPEYVPAQFSRASDAIEAATGQRPKLVRTAGGLINDQVVAEAKRQGLAVINWDVIPFDWINDSNIAATRSVLMTQIKPSSVVLFHDTYSSTVDLVYQFIPVLKANGYHLVTASHLLGERAPGSTYGGRDNGPPANDLHDIAVEEIPSLPNTPSPKPMPNFPIIDIPGANSGGPTNGA
jgi:peptidoglycan/xylan/chitin deacetylase (PgdA/CDA1 family)